MKSKANAVTEYLKEHLENCGKTQKQVADEAGFENPNIISMLKNGDTKVPLERAAMLAKAAGADEAELICHVLREYHPATWAILEPLMAHNKLEFVALKLVRKAAKRDESATA